jgi:hypothetical protein
VRRELILELVRDTLHGHSSKRGPRAVLQDLALSVTSIWQSGDVSLFDPDEMPVHLAGSRDALGMIISTHGLSLCLSSVELFETIAEQIQVFQSAKQSLLRSMSITPHADRRFISIVCLALLTWITQNPVDHSSELSPISSKFRQWCLGGNLVLRRRKSINT